MPLQSDAQLTGYEGERWFRSQLPRGWLPQRPDTDVGIDFVIVISEPCELDKREFRVQVKSSKSLLRKENTIKLRNVKLSTIDYWFLSPLPTLIVAYDETEDCGYFRWHYKIYEEVRVKFEKGSRTVTINVPDKNKLNIAGWKVIRENLKWHYRNLATALADARNARSLLPTIHDLAAAAQQLTSIDHQPIHPDGRNDKQEGLLALYEMMQHRLVVTSLSNLRKELLPNSEGETRLRNWITTFDARVTAVFPNFSALERWDSATGDFRVAYARNLLHEYRPKLIEAILEMIMILTPGRFHKQD